MASYSNKRPLPSDGDDSDSKRIRSNDGSPAPPPPANGAGMSDLERKKQDAAARMAAVKAKLAASKPSGSTASPAPPAMAAATPPPPPPAAPAAAPPSNDVEARKAEAARKIAEMKAKMAAKRGGGDQQPGGTPTPPPMSESQQRVAEAKARAQQIAAQARDRSRTESPAVPTPPPRQDTGKTARGGLGIGLHPSLMGDLNAPSTTAGKGPRGPKFSTTKGNQQLEAPKINPYLADADNEEATRFDDNIYDPSLAVSKGGGRKTKQLVFNEKGKFMAQANALRQQARLEEMKARIAAETRKTEIEEASDRSFLVPAPPEVEWWDEGIVNPDGSEKIDAEDSIITALVQHPVILQAPQEKFQPAPKPLMLTPIEQKKLRRQRRMADMKEEQAKIRLGLVEPPPPKVKKSNMMRVLGEQAVKDPTAVEARVNREIAQRATDHEKANKDRQLTKEQRVEKLKTQQAADEGKGVKIAIFRVDNLSSGKHRYQIDINAKQNALTGMVVLHPDMNLIIVEGGAHSISNYKKLLLNRVKWSENTLPLSNNTSTPTTFAGNNDGTSKGASGESNKASQWLNPLNADGSLKDLGENQCQLVWEGDEGQRMFKKWGSKACETDGEAKEVLRRQKMENMWTLARSMGEQQQPREPGRAHIPAHLRGAGDTQLPLAVGDVAVKEVLVDKGGEFGFDGEGVVEGGGVVVFDSLEVGVGGFFVGVGVGGGVVGGIVGWLLKICAIVVGMVRGEFERGAEGGDVEEGGAHGAAGGGLGRDADEGVGAEDEGAPDEDFGAVAELEEDAEVQEPGGVGVVEAEVGVEGGEVAGADGAAEGEEEVREALGFGAVEEGRAWEAPEDDVRGEEVD
ncbi:hypothetical protein D0866_10509 [Hortaea werneckii]|uniref:Uncharacterized protein n=1 Tax=Hortaea werneckii TaxID=91943 RepID=A0A3M7AHL0_HORWE|nr:hypothetical protein D0866_10509 [Hortaea werneckii]